MPNMCSSGRKPDALAIQNVKHFFLTLFFFLKEGKRKWTAPPFSILIRLMGHAECRDPSVGVLWEMRMGEWGCRGRHLSLKRLKLCHCVLLDWKVIGSSSVTLQKWNYSKEHCNCAFFVWTPSFYFCVLLLKVVSCGRCISFLKKINTFNFYISIGVHSASWRRSTVLAAAGVSESLTVHPVVGFSPALAHVSKTIKSWLWPCSIPSKHDMDPLTTHPV